MGRSLIVVVEPNKDYMSRLEMGLVKVFWKAADLEFISDPEFFDEYFALPKKIDILVIDESMYTDGLRIHDIEKTFVLTERQEPESGDATQDVLYLYKFCNLNALLNRIASVKQTGSTTTEKRTRLIAVISPSGGSGSTTVSLGISACMRENLKSAFYLNPQMYQNFHYYLQSGDTLPMDMCMKIQEEGVDLNEKMKACFLKEGFTYFPPLRSSRESLGIPEAAYLRLAENILKSKEYDFIVVDLGNELTGGLIRFLDMADRVLVVTQQDAYAAFKLQILKKSMNFSDPDKYIFICNRFDRRRENALTDTGLEYSSVIHDYIETDEEAVRKGCEGLKNLEGMQRVAYMLI